MAGLVHRGGQPVEPYDRAYAGPWRTTWPDAEHAAAVQRVREEIERGEVYQVNVVGHRSAPLAGSPVAAAAQVAALGAQTGAAYGGVLAGNGWAVGSASPEQLVQVVGERVTTVPVKGTIAGGPEAVAALRASAKDRAEHVMIVDLERNDLAQVARTGSVTVEQLYDVQPWAELWHAGSRVAAQLTAGATALDVLRAVAPGGSVTGAPKRAACGVLAEVEPVGRGPAMGGLGFVSPGRLDLGLSIRTVAAANGQVHLWAGGGVTWSSEPAAEVAEAHAKAQPLLRALLS